MKDKKIQNIYYKLQLPSNVLKSLSSKENNGAQCFYYDTYV